jgi:N-acetylglutamate synthase-like GNAT family acetyltransferase
LARAAWPISPSGGWKRGTACERILRGLPEWFGIEASNVQYITDIEEMPTLVAVLDGKIAGFLTIKRHNPSTCEIHCLAVERMLHRHGTGRALVGEAEARPRADGTRLFQVKTAWAVDAG